MAIRTYYDEYKKIKHKAIRTTWDAWDKLSKEEQEKISSELTVICHVGFGEYYETHYKVVSNVNNLSVLECAIIADEGNLCFGYHTKGGLICVHTD